MTRDPVARSGSVDRFDRELARASANGHYIVMVVECPIERALTFDEDENRRSRGSSSHVFYNLRTLLTKYPLNFQAVFVNGRAEAARITVDVLAMGEQIKQIDLQYALEKGLL